MHRANRDSADETLDGFVDQYFISHNERNSTEPKSPLSGDGLALPFRGSVCTGRGDLAEDSIVPGDSLVGIGEGSPNSLGGRADRR